MQEIRKLLAGIRQVSVRLPQVGGFADGWRLWT
jgi:hypothetical protein